ncbi:hypothetical protein LTR37_016089 [Vermiconidia calcicola]|uniref:Uncharacterized protein n=1 Tax=Vermiconidia calcicola TaxID=1690605 RepID=A0ACC3MNW8_9PEZI|nr:hypothetical protein LTR37_016089 [Vermiconidia calcicola]
MGSRARYERIAADDTEDQSTPIAVPNSPPPSFRSQEGSRRPSQEETHQNEQERNLNDAFDAPSDHESDDDNPRDQRQLIPGNRTPTQSSSPDTSRSPRRPAVPERRVTEIPVFSPPTSSGRVVGGGSNTSDGVFANINAKPRPGEELEEKPPTYEQAAADATPPYWETTVLSPYGVSGNPDDVFVDGLLVGSLFSFVWNALISMSFQLIGFLLTYLLHTTHAAKHGSRAGLGITLVQYGFQMRYAAGQSPMDGAPGPNAPTDGVPDDPNAHNFNPNEVAGGGDGSGMGPHGITTADWLSYVLMVVGWFILIRAVTDFMRARRQEQIIRSSPDRGLGVAVVAENENPESSV